MGKILMFPTQRLLPISVADRKKHRVVLEVIDVKEPALTRWIAQRAIAKASGFGALSGFTDDAVSMGLKHRFTIGSIAAVRGFVRMTADLVASGKLVVKIDGTIVRTAVRRRA